MTIHASTSANGDTLTIRITGTLDFKSHAEFRRAYEGAPARPRSVVIDLAEADYIDSAALGMLLLMRQHFGEGASFAVTNAKPAVMKILQVANFQKLFKVA
jgi:anti-anti-sigma factor